MKAILLAGGQGTRLRPLTINTPKPIVPIFNRPFLRYQIDLLKQVPDIDEVILSLNYQPQQIEDMFGDGSAIGLTIRYVVEPTPLGTGGAVKYAGEGLTDSVVVFNGDVLTQIDLASVIELHRQRRAKATIVLTPVENPTAYGLVETDAQGNVRRFLEKPRADEITTNHINAGIYILEPDTFDRIPPGVPWSIERRYFPSLVERQDTFVAYVCDGYWIDIGTPEMYTQVHRDIMDGRYVTAPFLGLAPAATAVAPDAHIEDGAIVEGPCFIDQGVNVRKGARIGPYSVIGRDTQVGKDASVEGAILWPHCHVGQEATVRNAILGRNCYLGRSVSVDGHAVLGDNTTLTDYTQIRL
ncbi:MAG: sugar phosphate nucleotidyltransferase [Vicinamibacterales bacterium]